MKEIIDALQQLAQAAHQIDNGIYRVIGALDAEFEKKTNTRTLMNKHRTLKT